MTETTHLGMGLPDFDSGVWHEAVNENFQLLDAVTFALSGLNIQGAWQNATLYEVGARVIDTVAGTLWQCAVAHTSSSSGTFSAYRTAHSTHWTQLGITADLQVRQVTVTGDIDVLTTDDIVLVNKSANETTN